MLKRFLLFSVSAAAAIPFAAGAASSFITQSSDNVAVEDEIMDYNADAGTTLKDDVRDVVEEPAKEKLFDDEPVKPAILQNPMAPSPVQDDIEDETDSDLEEDDESLENPLANNSHFLSVDLKDSSLDVKVKMGQILEVVLEDNASREWNFDKSTKFLKVLDTNNIDGKFKVTFEVTNAGFERIYFDWIDKSDGGFKVVQSRILDVTAEM